MNLILLLLLIDLINCSQTAEVSIQSRHIDKLEHIIKSTDNSGLILLHLTHGLPDKTYGICADNISMIVANVMCQQMKKGMAQHTVEYPIPERTKSLIFLVRTNCYGDEVYLKACVKTMHLRSINRCKSSSLFGVRCVQALPNLVPDVESLESSVYVHTEPIYHLKCAMEENCLVDKTIGKYGNWSQEQLYTLSDEKELQRKLLRFSSIIKNKGNAAFLPHLTNESWQWHSCHEHYHSMDIFAIYQIFTLSTNSLDDKEGLVLAGHKASFCLEDNLCVDGVKPYFKCSRNKSTTGNQGISPGCSDTYLHDIDCQWIDITFLPYGRYIFRLVINPHLKIAESNYYDNAIVCELFYFSHYEGLHYCHLTHLLTFW